MKKKKEKRNVGGCSKFREAVSEFFGFQNLYLIKFASAHHNNYIYYARIKFLIFSTYIFLMCCLIFQSSKKFLINDFENLIS